MTSFSSSSYTDRIASRQAPSGFISRWLAAWRTRRGQQVTIERLAKLDNRTLQDIGLDRAEIDSAVYDTRMERLRRYDERWWDPFAR